MNFTDPTESTVSEMVIEELALMANAIPVVGGIVSGIAVDYVSSRKNTRLNIFLKELYKELKQLGEKISEDKANDEEFRNIVEDIFDKASACRQQDKLDAFRALFINITIANAPDYNEALEVASLIDRWQDRHVIVIKLLEDPWGATGEKMGSGYGSMGSIIGALRNALKWDDEQITRTWAELYATRIINTEGIKVMMSTSGAAALENRLTPFGLTVARYTKNPSKN